MTDQLPERLDGDISISASIEKTGLTAAAKGRTFVAIDRLIGGTVDIFAARVEGIRNRELLKSQVQTTALQIAADRYLANVENVPDLARRGLGHMMREEARKQANREAVAEASIEQLTLPPPTSSPDGDEAGAEAALDEDWLNAFCRHAEDASSERFQLLWGRILAGEIRKPGFFSRSTLRVISELDGTIAKVFETFAADRIDRHLIRGESLNGSRLTDAGLLVGAGLLNDTGGFMHLKLHDRALIHGDTQVLRLSAPPGVRSEFFIIPLSRAGYEIARILPHDETAALKRAEKFVQGDFNVTLCRKRPHPTDSRHILLDEIEVLRDRGAIP